MKITFDVRPFQKPLEHPQRITKKVSGDNFSIPLVKADRKPIITIKPVTITRIPKKTTKSFKFGLASPKNKSFMITPVPSTKNDKVHLLIESFGNSYREISHQINQFDFKNPQLPEQDKFFFETVIQRDSFNHYITTNESNEEFVKQQTEFCWFRSPIVDVEKDIYDSIDESKSVGFDFSLKYTSGLSLKMDSRLQERPLRDLLELSKLLKPEEKIIVQFGFQSAENDWYKDAESSSKELPKRIKVGQNSKDKIGFNGFECCLRLIVQGESKLRSEVISRGFITALKQVNGDNELVEKKIKDNKFRKWLNQKVRTRKIPTHFMFKKRFILTYKEMLHFIKLPQRTLQTEYEIEVNEKGVTNVHNNFLSKKGLWLGDVSVKGKNEEFRLPTNDLDQLCGTYGFIGEPRSGKDMSCSRFIIELAKNGHGAIVPDAIDESGRGMADIIKQNLSKEKIVDVDLADFMNPIHFGLGDIVEAIGIHGVDVIANDVVGILELDQNYSSKQLARLVAKACNCNLYEMFNFLKSKKYAKMILERVRESGNELLSLQLQKEYFEVNIPANIKGAVINRLDELMSMGITKNLFAAPKNPAFDLQRFIEENKVVLIRMKKDGGLGEQGTKVMINLILLKVNWLKKIKKTDNVTFLVFNEFHQYATNTFNEMLSSLILESPKYRLGINLIFHTPLKIDKKLWECIQSGAKGLFLFKNGNLGIFRDLMERIKPLDMDACLKIAKHESLFLSNIDGSEPFFIKMKPTDKFDKDYISNKQTKKYGTNVEVVNNYVYTTEKWMYEPEEEKETKEKD
ncbi:hypothetical protein [Microcystis phage MaeS]|nr:hypothetical protein [Microcystis phage MaeS]